MASTMESKKRLITARSFATFILIILSSVTLTLAFGHGVIISWPSIIFTHRALLSYSVIVPFCSVILLSLEHLLGTAEPDTLSKLNYHLSMLMISILLSCGWIINTTFWTRCEVFGANHWNCPLELQNLTVASSRAAKMASAAKIVFGWMDVVFYVVHTGLVAVEATNEYLVTGTDLLKQELLEQDWAEGPLYKTLEN